MEFFERAPIKKRNQAEDVEDELLIEKYVVYKSDVSSVNNLRDSWKFLRSIIFGGEAEKTMDDYLRGIEEEEIKGEIENMEKKFDNLLRERGLADMALEALRNRLK